MDILKLLSGAAVLGITAAAAYFDIKERRIPNTLTAAAAVTGIAASVIRCAVGNTAALTDALLGAFLGGGLFLIGYIAPKKGIGAGDVKLTAALGLYLGSTGILVTSLIALISAAVYAAVRALRRRESVLNERIPLVPFIFFGTAVTVFCL